MRCPGCGKKINGSRCGKCGFDLKKSVVLSAFKLDDQGLVRINESLRDEAKKSAGESKKAESAKTFEKTGQTAGGKWRTVEERRQSAETEWYWAEDEKILARFRAKLDKTDAEAKLYTTDLRRKFFSSGSTLQELKKACADCENYYNGEYLKAATAAAVSANETKGLLHNEWAIAGVDEKIETFMSNRKMMQDTISHAQARIQQMTEQAAEAQRQAEEQRRRKEAEEEQKRIAEENRKKKEQEEAEVQKQKRREEERLLKEQQAREQQEKEQQERALQERQLPEQGKERQENKRRVRASQSRQRRQLMIRRSADIAVYVVLIIILLVYIYFSWINR